MSKTISIYYGGFMGFGGVNSHVRSLSSELQRMGYEVVVITLDSLPIWCRYLPHLVEKIINFFDRPMGYFYKDRFTGKLYKLFFNNKVDIRIFEDIYISWNSEIRSICILHATWSDNLQAHDISLFQHEKLKKNEIKTLNLIKHPVVTVSQPYLDYLLNDHFTIALCKKIGVIELGIDQSFSVNKFNSNKKSIIYVGTLEARKNILFLLHVFKKIYDSDKNYQLTIVGNGPDRKKLEIFSQENNLKVNFLGAIKHDQVLRELKSHGIYLHTSVKESFSYALLEAKLSGLKTFASEKLQVPKEFIDVPMKNFDIDDWYNEIINIDWSPAIFNTEKYSLSRMTTNTISTAE